MLPNFDRLSPRSNVWRTSHLASKPFITKQVHRFNVSIPHVVMKLLRGSLATSNSTPHILSRAIYLRPPLASEKSPGIELLQLYTRAYFDFPCYMFVPNFDIFLEHGCIQGHLYLVNGLVFVWVVISKNCPLCSP